MNLLVLGATGQTGRRFVKVSATKHAVTSFGRREAPGAQRSIVGSFDDPEFAGCVQNADAVISCLASSNKQPVCSIAAKAVLAAKPDARFVTVAGAAVDQPNDNKGIPDKAIGLIMKMTVGAMLADRQKEVDMLRNSRASWTALRPPRLMNDRNTGHWQTSFDRPQATWIDRDDLALALLQIVEHEEFVREAPFIAAAPGDKK